MYSYWPSFEFIVFASTILYASERSLQQSNRVVLIIDIIVTKFLIHKFIFTHPKWLAFFFYFYFGWPIITLLIKLTIPVRTRRRWALVANGSFHVIRAYTRLSRTMLLRHWLLITTRISSRLIIPMRTRIRWAAKKEICSSRSRWSKELPEDMLRLIQQRLPISDQFQFRAVCRCWRATGGVVSLPWLMLGSHPLSNTDPFFFSPSEKKAYHSCPPLMRRRGCVGSIEGWLIMVDNVLWRPEGFMSPRSFFSLLHTSSTNFHTDNFFFNPMSSARVNLPSQSTIPCPNSNQPSFFSKVIASCVPTRSNCLVAAICSDGGLAFCRPSDESWTFIDQARLLTFDDIEIMDGKLYAAPTWSNEDASHLLMVFEIQANGGGCLPTYTVRLPWTAPSRQVNGGEVKITCHSIHLAKDSTSKDLFMILRHNSFVIENDPPIPWSVITGDTNFVVPPKTRGFRVFKLEQNAHGHPGWLEIFDLGNRILFVSGAANKLMDHLQDKILERNCIYFAFDYSSLSLASVLDIFLSGKSTMERHDVGVFSLKDSKIRPLTNFPNCPTQLRAPSVWFTPNTTT